MFVFNYLIKKITWFYCHIIIKQNIKIIKFLLLILKYNKKVFALINLGWSNIYIILKLAKKLNLKC